MKATMKANTKLNTTGFVKLNANLPILLGWDSMIHPK